MRKRSMEDDQDAEMDQGRVKKVKKYREEAHAYRGGHNPFQVVVGVERNRAGFSIAYFYDIKFVVENIV